MVFTHATDIYSYLPGSGSVCTQQTLSSVNRHWRQVALSTPSVWTTACITSEDVQDGQLYLGPLTNCLKRSGDRSLDIVIDARDPDWNFYEPECVSPPTPSCSR